MRKHFKQLPANSQDLENTSWRLKLDNLLLFREMIQKLGLFLNQLELVLKLTSTIVSMLILHINVDIYIYNLLVI